jgi:hypothetical protein
MSENAAMMADNTISLPVLLSVFGGASLALFGGGLGRRYQTKATGRAVAVAFWEELKATRFYVDTSSHNMGPLIGGFSSQTFDTLFAEMVRSLPESLVRSLMGYHLRVKYLLELQATGILLGNHQAFYDEAEASRADLLARLNAYSSRLTIDLVCFPPEMTSWEIGKPWQLSLSGGGR